MERAERHELGAAVREDGEARRVVEGECLVARDADAAVPRLRLALWHIDFELWRQAGQVQDGLDVKRLGDGCAHRLDGLTLALVLGDGHEAEVALRHLERIVAAQRAEHADARILHGAADHLLMRRRAEPVEDDAGQVDLRVVVAEPAGNRRGRSAHRLDIEDEHDRRLEQLGDGRRGAHALTPAVVEAHDALDDGDIRPLHRPRKELRQHLLWHEPAVEIMCRAAAGHRVVAGIDVVGADLEGLDRDALLAQGRQQPRRNRRLARTGLRRRNH